MRRSLHIPAIALVALSMAAISECSRPKIPLRRILEETTDYDESIHCYLSDGTEVPGRWAGFDNELNWCNRCRCMETGTLACTRMKCHEDIKSEEQRQAVLDEAHELSARRHNLEDILTRVTGHKVGPGLAEKYLHDPEEWDEGDADYDSYSDMDYVDEE